MNFLIVLATPPILNTVGIVLSSIGVIILFYFGMPFHVPTGGSIGIAIEEINQDDVRIERRNAILGYLGLIMIIAGASIQIVAAWIQ